MCTYSKCHSRYTFTKKKQKDLFKLENSGNPLARVKKWETRAGRGPPLFKQFSPTLWTKRNFFSAILLLENYAFFSRSGANRVWAIRIWRWKIRILVGKQRKEDLLAGRSAKRSLGRFWSEKISGKNFRTFDDEWPKWLLIEQLIGRAEFA